MIPVATPTFKEAMFPSIGMLVLKSAMLIKSDVIPFSSEPITIAIAPLKLTSCKGIDDFSVQATILYPDCCI